MRQLLTCAATPEHQHASSAPPPLPLRPGERFQEITYAKPAQARALDATTPAEGWTCFGWAGMPGELLEKCGYAVPEPGDTQACDVTVSGPMTVYATRDHMHLLGRSVKVEPNPCTADEMCLGMPTTSIRS